MLSIRINIPTFIAALLVAMAQLLPASMAAACDRGCCGTASTSCCGKPTQSETESSSQCPLCQAAGTKANTLTPCRCQLGSRHEAAKVSHSRPTSELRLNDFTGMAQVAFEQPVGVATLAEPASNSGPCIVSRPARILFGVWRI